MRPLESRCWNSHNSPPFQGTQLRKNFLASGGDIQVMKTFALETSCLHSALWFSRAASTLFYRWRLVPSVLLITRRPRPESTMTRDYLGKRGPWPCYTSRLGHRDMYVEEVPRIQRPRGEGRPHLTVRSPLAGRLLFSSSSSIRVLNRQISPVARESNSSCCFRISPSNLSSWAKRTLCCSSRTRLRRAN